MINVLVVMDVYEEHKEILKSVSPLLKIEFVPAMKVLTSDLENVDVIVGNLNPALLSYCKRLKLLQLSSAGTEGFTAEGVLPQGAVLANATGAYGLAISEHMLASLLCLMKKIDLYKINQMNHDWKDMGNVPSVYGTKTLIVGFGDIGNEFGSRMHAFGSTIIGIRKNMDKKPAYVEAMYGMEQLKECCKEADIVANCLPGNATTRKIFDERVFTSMKQGAYFINVGRGNTVDTKALYQALESKKLAGAALDVTDPEPLPEDHELWDMPNVLITPHVSGGYHVKETHDRIIQIAAKNLAHLVKGEPFENLVDMTYGYRINV